MGHADITTTMNIYAEATKARKKEAFANLEGKIKIRQPTTKLPLDIACLTFLFLPAIILVRN